MALNVLPQEPMDAIWQDARFALRTLGKNPGFAAVAIITLALGIGANTAIFSLVNAVFLQPLPFVDSARLVLVGTTSRQSPQLLPVSYPEFQDWQNQSTAFQGLAAYISNNLALTGQGEPERLGAEQVSHNYFSLLGVRPVMGRTFLPEEDRVPQGEMVAVVSHALWERRFSSDPKLIGRTIVLEQNAYTVVGVAPPGFQGVTGGAEVWIPITVLPPNFRDFLTHRGARWLQVVGKLKSQVGHEQGQAELDTIMVRLGTEHPNSNRDRGARVNPLAEFLITDVRVSVLVMSAAVGLVLLIACANVAGLLLARMAGRRREVAIRVALGAGARRLTWQFITESMILSAAGALLGVLMASWGLDFLRGFTENLIPSYMRVGLDSPVLAFTLGLTALTGLLFGVGPALRTARLELYPTLKEGGRGPASGNVRQRFRSVLVVSQLALAVVLLIAGGLLLRSLQKTMALDPGFDPRRALTARFDLPDPGYSRPQAVQLARQLVERLEATPGVRAASLSMAVPLGTGVGNPASFLQVEGVPVNNPQEDAVRVYFHECTEGFFRTLGIPVRLGRTFTAQDTLDSLPVVIVSESAARKMWPDRDPVGMKVRFVSSRARQVWLTVVGVVGDVRFRALVGGADNDPDIYLPLAQATAPILTPTFAVTLRTQNDPEAMAPTLREILREMDPNLPLYNIASLEQNMAQATRQARTITSLLGFFAVAALVLSAIGIYGLVAYSVAQRTHEIGIRMALGAQRSQILGLILGQGSKLVLAGAGIGVLAALGATRFLASLLFGIEPTDGVTFSVVLLLLSVVALAACYIPARRATRVDPIVALRHE